MNIERLGICLSAISIIVAVVTFLLSFHRTKRVETISALNELYDGYYALDKKNHHDNYREFVSYMSKVERFAIAVNENIYSKRIVKKQASIFMKSMYDSFIKEIIAQRRKQFKRDNYYENIVRLIESF